VRYADDLRNGRMWAGYVTIAGCSVPDEGKQVTEFERAVAAYFQSPNVKAEICDRSRPRLFKQADSLVQITIYREGRLSERKAFVDRALEWVPDRPVLEAAITYNREDGVTEVVADNRDTRETLVRLFADHLLGTPALGQRLPVRQFSLDHLRRQYAFPTDVEDNIQGVSVKLMRLMPYDTQSERVTLECMRGGTRNIWTMAETRFGPNNPLNLGYTVTQVRLTMTFGSVPGQRPGHKLPVTITMPQGCNLKDRTERERLIGEKYLRRWGFLRDVA
jgi:hypothetical protein